MAAATDLYDVAAEWLELCAEAVATAPGGAIDPDFVYVAPGPPALDCPPMLTVHSPGTAEAATSPTGAVAEGQRVRGPALHFVALYATVIRCTPVLDSEGEPPPGSEIGASARETMSDLWAILNYTRKRHQQGLLFPSPSGKREVFVDPQIPVQTEGGAAGYVIPIRVQLDGYAISS